MITRRLPHQIDPAPALVALFALLIGTALPASAVPYLESGYGGQSPWYSAEINALGASGGAAYRGGFSTILNPAGLGAADTWRLDAGVGFAYHEEERFVPLYDSFENYVTDQSIASNQRTWTETGFALAGRLNLGDLPLGVGLSLADRYPFSYEFTEEVRDPDVFSDPRDRILEERMQEVTGTLRTLSFGIAGEAQRVALGASVHYAFGERTEQRRVRDYATDDATGDDSFDTESSWDLSGVNATIGAQVMPNERLTLSVAYETALSVDGELETTTYAAGPDTTVIGEADHSLEYPARWRLGAAIYPRNDPRTVLTVDVVLTGWEDDLVDDREDLADDRRTAPRYLQDVVDVRVGLRHEFRGGQELNVGFRRYDSYNDPEGGNSIFSAGTAWPVGPGRLAVALELNKLQTRDVPHLFDYPDDGYVVPDEARVDDLRLRFGVGWTQEF
ncbi:hypothetical protein GF314_04170 [bacterium]|nr:hypothetical protein [bacterium]